MVIPLLIAKVMTFPEVANSTNMEHLKKLIINGPDNHPGANYVINRKDQTKQYISATFSHARPMFGWVRFMNVCYVDF